MDIDRLYGDYLAEAAAYLLEVSEKYPTASLEEVWDGYESMQMMFSYTREETDEEVQRREAQEAAKKALQEKMARAEKTRQAKMKQFNKLKRELGIP